MQGSDLLSLFTSHVRSRRRELGLTQRELADRMGVSQAYVAGMESGVSTPGLNVVAKFAEALNTTPIALLTTEEIFSTP